MPVTKKKFESKGGGKPNGNRTRNILRSGNRAWMIKFKVKTRQFRRDRTAEPPGQPRGIHDTKNPTICRCGRCSNGVTEKN
jgi:hypothetical protein